MGLAEQHPERLLRQSILGTTKSHSSSHEATSPIIFVFSFTDSVPALYVCRLISRLVWFLARQQTWLIWYEVRGIL
jgi:hypothetical protein